MPQRRHQHFTTKQMSGARRAVKLSSWPSCPRG
jgi:hypothetical protein